MLILTEASNRRSPFSWPIGNRSENRALEPGQHACLDVNGVDMVLCNVEGELFAVENECPHAGLPLGDGELTDCILTCPYHGYAYDVRSGKNIDFPDSETPARVFPIRIENGQVEIDTEAR